MRAGSNGIRGRSWNGDGRGRESLSEATIQMEVYYATKTPDPITVILAQGPEPLIKRLDDPTRAKVLAALAGLIILGFALVLLAWLGARVTQRYRWGASYFRPTTRPGEHEWTKKPLEPPDSDSPTSDL